MDVRVARLEGARIPLAIEARDPLPLETWIGGRRAWLRDQLHEQGALLFRGFGSAAPERLAAFVEAAGFPLMDYPRGNTHRTQVGERIYTASETRSELPIPLHSEMAYTSLYPEALAFCCVEAASEGGATPLADLRGVLERIPAGFVDEVARRGLRYRQIVPLTATSALERSWPAMFATSDRAEVERLCAAQGIACDWFEDGSLALTGHCPGLRPHPRSGEPVWFNQAHTFHIRLFRNLAKHGVGDALEQEREFAGRYAQERLEPYQCRFGDGGELPEEEMSQVRKAFEAQSERFDWRPGDVLLIDNFRVAHGREAFRGSRRVLAALISRAWDA